MPSLKGMRKRHAARSKPPREPQAPSDEAEENEDAEGQTSEAAGVSEDDFLLSGRGAEQKAKEQAAANARRNVREFFITTKECEASEDGNVTVSTHCCVNYAEPSHLDEGWDLHNMMAVATVQIPEGSGFGTYTSREGDCCFRDAGLSPSIRPCFVLMDHRSHKASNGKVYKDDIKVWRPSSGQMAQMRQAIVNLAENIGLDPHDPAELAKIDLTQYECRISKLAAAKRATWSISFIARKRPMTKEQQEKVAKWFATKITPQGLYIDHETHRKKMRVLLAPDPRFMPSKGGSYTPRKRQSEDKETAGEARSKAGLKDEEPPY